MNPKDIQTVDPFDKKIRDLKSQIELLESQKHSIIQNCQHDWIVQYDPIYTEGYLIPGDPPGFGGVDRRSDFYVSPETKPRWKRTCRRCNTVEYTTRSQTHETKTPIF